MKKERYLRSVRLLAECYHAFERLSGSHVRTLGLTPPQFDIIATLGNTEGMSFKELGERTLITKGTLTGVIDRLEAKSLVRRIVSTEDRRSTTVKLTAKGEALFNRVFPPHIEFCKQPFLGWRDPDFGALERELAKLKARLEEAANS